MKAIFVSILFLFLSIVVTMFMDLFVGISMYELLNHVTLTLWLLSIPEYISLIFLVLILFIKPLLTLIKKLYGKKFN